MATNSAINTSNPIGVASGGTGLATLTAHSVQVGAGTSVLTQIGVGSNGQCLLGSTGADPVFAALTSSAGTITYSVGAGTLNLEVTTPAVDQLTWTVITASTQAAAVNHGYICNYAGQLVVTLPATAAVGTLISVTGMNTAAGWKVAQNAGQQIFFGTSTTTSGTGGSLAGTNIYDVVQLVCNTANTTWIVLGSIGNITVV